MKSLRKLFNKINIDSEILFDEPLSEHSTFKIGGNADAYVRVKSSEDIIHIKKITDCENIPLYPLGEGANILFSDRGYRGIILDTSLLNSFDIITRPGEKRESDFSPETSEESSHQADSLKNDEVVIRAAAGVRISSLAKLCTLKGLEGLENFYGMPGFVGGSIYMNARCYGVSISERIKTVCYIDENSYKKEYLFCSNDFAYKKSPFQNKNVIITDALFSLKKSSSPDLSEKMFSYKEERKSKGHYLYPCAGSVFKNNRDFGEPTGRIIDRLGLRGYSVGDAAVSEKHANIIVNKGNASAKDIKKLIDYVSDRVFNTYGFQLEREVIYVDEEVK